MFTLAELARRVGGEVEGNPEIRISGVRPFEGARPGDVTLAASGRYLENLSATDAAAVIVDFQTPTSSKPLLRVSNPKLAFAQVVNLFHPRRFQARGVSPGAVVGRECRISENVAVGPFVHIGDQVEVDDEVTIGSGASIGDRCRIGAGSVLHPNVTLYPDVRLGQRVILHAGTVIGADGFGYVFDGQSQVKVPQTGGVVLGDDVEIGANSCVDRAAFGDTVIEKGVKLDNHVHVGHNCRIGENTVVVGCVGISGSVQIGKNCILAGQSGVIDHIKIGDDVTVMVKTAVVKDVPSGSVISGLHGRDHRQQLRVDAAVRRLPEIYREWRELKALVRELLEERKES